MELIKYYTIKNGLKFSNFIKLEIVRKMGFNNFFDIFSRDKDRLVEIIAYCLMPTHFHLILKQMIDNGIFLYLRDLQNSYSHYFNIKHRRKGPLWESRFKNVLVSNDEQLIHLTRYLHLNPVTASLVNKPEDWLYSSYREYIDEVSGTNKICLFDEVIEIIPASYWKFVNNQVDYQRELGKIKKMILD